jgi:hypothetical protein
VEEKGMNNRGNTRIIITLACIMSGFILFQWAIAGNLDPVAGPSSPGSAMYTLTDIYNRLFDNTPGTKRSGAFAEPGAAPGSTGYTLDEIYNIAIPTQVPRTGQTVSVASGDDGNLRAGIAHPATRFVDNGDGTVTDNLTGLIWLKDANCRGLKNWTGMLEEIGYLFDGCTSCSGGWDCGLSDGSTAGDWRLPNIREMQSLIDYGRRNPALPNGHPFTNVQSPVLMGVNTDGYVSGGGTSYWTSTFRNGEVISKWSVNLHYGQPVLAGQTLTMYAWPVKGGR